MIRFFAWQLLLALDQLVNVLFGGYADEYANITTGGNKNETWSSAKNRGVPVDALRAGAYKKTMMFEAISATVTGQRQKYSDQLRAAKTLADIEAINVIYG